MINGAASEDTKALLADISAISAEIARNASYELGEGIDAIQADIDSYGRNKS